MSATWRITRASYYADWTTVPVLGIGALATALYYHGLTLALLCGIFAGGLFMSFFEYAIHRWAFHDPRLYRREHWLHHIRPADYVGIPGSHTFLYFLLALGGCIGGFGLDLGAGVFAGIGAMYLTYIVSHDWYHHNMWSSAASGYWGRQCRRHMIHHEKGIEANFGVSTPLWDLLLGTYVPAK